MGITAVTASKTQFVGGGNGAARAMASVADRAKTSSEASREMTS